MQFCQYSHCKLGGHTRQGLPHSTQVGYFLVSGRGGSVLETTVQSTNPLLPLKRRGSWLLGLSGSITSCAVFGRT